jgi:nicotinamide-nucleotide amidase
VSRIEILTIGDELVEGRLVDTNAAELSERLTARGLGVVRHQSVGDDLQRIADALREAAGRSDAVLVSGGLGPTGDDLTAAAAAAAFGLPLRRIPEALDHVRRFFAERGRAMTDNNAKQADLPDGCTLLPNPEGTAVGFRLVDGGCRLYFMPGVPRELHRIFIDSVLPDLESFLQASPAAIATIKVFGKGESEVAQRLDGVDADLPDGVRLVIQYRATFPEIHVRFVASGHGAEAVVEQLSERARQRLGHSAFAWGGAVVATTFADHVASSLRAAGHTLAAAEGCSGGELAALLSAAADSEEVFHGTVVASGRSAQRRMLGVEDEPAGGPDTLPTSAEALARAARERFGADLGVATVGSVDGRDGQPPGTLVVAVATDREASSRSLLFPVDAERYRRLAAYVALALVVGSLER